MRTCRHVGRLGLSRPGGEAAFVLILAAALGIGATTGAIAQEERGKGRRAPQQEEPMIVGLEGVADEIQKMGPWEEQFADYVEPGFRNIWRDNGWNGESDRFALSVATEVARIPPWKVTERLQKLASMAGQRYGLRPEQASRLQQSVIRESASLLFKHAPMILEQVQKGVKVDQQFREEGMSQEAVSRLMAEFVAVTEDMHEDVRSSFERVMAGFEKDLDGPQKVLFERDARTAEKLMAHSDRLRAEWAQGRWTPRDIGLTDDMMMKAYGRTWTKGEVSSAGASAAGSGPPDANAASLPTRWAAHDPHTWNAYARHVIARFSFDPAQVAAAWSVHDELRQRALDYLQVRREDADKVEKSARATDPLYQPVRELFDVLITRLDAIPTQAQRDGVRNSE